MRSFSRARFLADSNYGRDAGWYVELDGEVVAELTDAEWSDMFWDSYAVRVPEGADRALPPACDVSLWEGGRLKFRNRATGEVAPHAFAGGVPPRVLDGRISMRGLYLQPSTWLEAFAVKLLTLKRDVRYTTRGGAGVVGRLRKRR